MRVRDIRCLWSYLNVHPVVLIAPISVNIVVDARVAARGLDMAGRHLKMGNHQGLGIL